jgi:hypothetical protein
MFRIRRIYDDVLPVNRAAIEQVKTILRSRFPMLPPDEIDQLGRRLHDPFLNKKAVHPTLRLAERTAARPAIAAQGKAAVNRFFYQWGWLPMPLPITSSVSVTTMNAWGSCWRTMSLKRDSSWKVRTE